MRRGVGVGAIQQRQAMQARQAAAADSLAADRAKHVQEQLALFRKHLEEFAAKHRHEINRDPEFRRAFAQMAKSIGVDPLASSRGFWGELLGLGDFYFELSVQVVDVCLATRGLNGGLIALSDLRSRLQELRGRASQRISEEDVRSALRKLECLGGGYRIVSLGASPFVLSVPSELSHDSTTVLQAAGEGGAAGCISLPELCARYGWETRRARAACDRLMSDGLAWADDQAPPARRPVYYFPAVWQAAVAPKGAA